MALPDACPWLRIAFVKYCYKQEPKNGICPHPDLARVKVLGDAMCGEAETVLKLLHVKLASQVAQLPVDDAAKLLSGLAGAAVAGLLATNGKGPYKHRQDALVKHVAPALRYAHKVFSKLPNRDKVPELPTLLPGWFPADLLKEGAQAEPAADERILPVLIEYDSNHQPVNKQEVRVVTQDKPPVAIPWAAWLESGTARNKLMNSQAKSLVLNSMVTMQLDGAGRVPPSLQLLRDSKGAISVVAGADMKPGDLRLPVLVTGPLLLSDKSHHHHAVNVRYEALSPGADTGVPKGQVLWTVQFKCSPELALPKVSAGEEVKWEIKDAPILFWAVRRSHGEEEELGWNCDLEEIHVGEVCVASFAQEAFTDRAPSKHLGRSCVPVMVNVRDVKAGEELVLRWAKPPAPKKKEVTRTWQDDVAAAAKKQRRDKD